MSRREDRVEVHGIEHRVLTWGGAGEPTVVLCHGFLDTAGSFGPLASRLAEAGLRVVAFDWRGHGRSDRVGAGGYYHFPDYIRDLEALWPTLAPEGSAHLLGHSMGGTACALFAATRPARVRSLTLVEGLGPPEYEGAPVDKMRAWLDSMKRLEDKPSRGPSDLADAVRRLRLRTPELPEAFALELAAEATEVDEDGGLRWRFDPLHRTTSPSPFLAAPFESFLAHIEAPTLVVGGSRGFRTADHASRLGALPDAREVIIDDVGHMIHWMAAEALARLVIDHTRARDEGER